MAFFLLGRVDDTLKLLCPDTFTSRQDALAALSSVTAEPGFDLWDAEVLLVDTDAGTPVLLMRPQTATQASVAPLEEELEVVVVDELDDEPLPEAPESEDVVAEESPAEEAPADAPAEESPAEDAPAEEAPAEEPFVVAADDSAPEIIAEAEAEIVLDDEHAASDVPVEAVEDPALAEVIIEEFQAEEDAAGALKAALSRTAAQMEAEGIVAPESIAAATVTVELDTDLEPRPEPAEQEWPWDVVAETEPTISPEIAFVMSDLEEPSLDDGSILRGSIDDETFAAARPVIMGSYSEPRDDAETRAADVIDDAPPVEPMGLIDIQPPVAPLPSSSGFAVPVVGDAGDIFPLDALVDATEPIESSSVPSAASTDDSAISDFILDLGDAPVIDAAVPSADTAALDEYTCADCVYEETCPNKDQRLPKDCGSFQWR